MSTFLQLLPYDVTGVGKFVRCSCGRGLLMLNHAGIIPNQNHGSLVMSPLNITQPLGIWSIMATIRWCPIFPKWDIYQPLRILQKNIKNARPISSVQLRIIKGLLVGYGATVTATITLRRGPYRSCSICNSSGTSAGGKAEHFSSAWPFPPFRHRFSTSALNSTCFSHRGIHGNTDWG